MANQKCPQCNFVNFADAISCKRCGASLYDEPESTYSEQQEVVTAASTKPKQTKPAVLVEVAPKKLSFVAGIMWIIVLLGCILSAIQIYYAYREDNSPKQTASIAFGLALVVIPYCFARAVDKLSG